MATRTYDPKQVAFSYKGYTLSGYADGTFIEVEFDEDSFTKYIGASGEGARSRNANRAGKITVHLMSTSPDNDVLSAFEAADRLGSADGGTGPAFGKDVSGTSQFLARDAWIKKLPKVDFAKEISVRDWEFDATDLEVLAGGNN